MGNSGLKIKNNIFKILIELFVFDKKKRSIIKARWAKKHLKKYVDMAVLKTLEASCKDEAACTYKNPSIKQDEEIIWQYWHQGRENAPELIKKCLESVEKFEGDKKIIVLSFDTVKDYVKIPEKYYNYVKNGKMTMTFFSDIIRCYLLNQYGGLWVDSTIFLTEKIPEDIWGADFCVLRKDPKIDNLENKMSSFFIRAKKDNINIRTLRDAIGYYWHENDFLINYFLIEHAASMLPDASEKLKVEWDKMPYYDAKITGRLQEILYDDFDKNTWEKIKSKTGIHKLSYKILRDTSSKKSYYDLIIKEKLK